MKSMTGDMIRIAVFYDGNFFFHVSNYYQFHHERRSRLSVGGLHAYIREEVARLEDFDTRFCAITDAHYYRGRPRAGEGDDREAVVRDRGFDETLIREGVLPHYLLAAREGDSSVEVHLALDAYELASLGKFDVAVVIAASGSYAPLMRKLNARGIRVMVLGWDFHYTDANGYERETRTSPAILEAATYPVPMVGVIDDRARRSEALITGLFAATPPRREYTSPPPERVERVERPERMERPERDDRPERSTAVAPPSGASFQEPQGIEMVGMISALRNGYGFITPAIGGDNIFFFHADVAGSEFLNLHVGQKVEYISSVNERGPCAKNVNVVG